MYLAVRSFKFTKGTDFSQICQRMEGLRLRADSAEIPHHHGFTQALTELEEGSKNIPGIGPQILTRIDPELLPNKRKCDVY